MISPRVRPPTGRNWWRSPSEIGVTKGPTLPYDRVIRALQRDGWVVVRQRGSHIRLQKHAGQKTLKIIVPTHRPIKRSTLAHILKQAQLSVEDFLALL